jgi:glycosyltransferase involved in cell wall biosynthesis/SAM-dependent methyltransferase
MPRFTLSCTKPVAVDSPDHLAPRGTKNDNSRNRLFNRKLESLLNVRPLRILDFGCAGGGFVKDCLDDGHVAAGLEGSDYSQRTNRAEWATIPQHLFTCDITAPFTLAEAPAQAPAQMPALFNVITGWEFMEHIAPHDIAKVAENALRHLAPGGIILFSIADFPDSDNGVTYHQTVQPYDWWVRAFAELGLTHHPVLSDYFGHDWIRGPYQGSQSFHLVMTRTADAPPAVPAGRPYTTADLLQTAGAFLQSGIDGRNTGGATRNIDYALLCYEAALKMENHLDARAGRAVCLMHLGRKREALSAAQRLLAIHPDHALARQVVDLLAPPASPPPLASPAPAASTGIHFSNITVAPDAPKISIVTPTFNCARYLRACIESVMAQRYPNFEHIIADGASTDDTIQLLKQYPHVKWLSEPDDGEAEALNKALRLSTGDIVNWLNADDTYVGSTVFHTIAEQFRVHPSADVLYGKCAIINEQDDVVDWSVPRAPLTLPVLMRWFHHLHLMQPSIFYTRKVAQSVGDYREDLFFSIDLDYWLRTAAAGFSFQFVDRTLSQSRLVREGAKSAHPRLLQEKNWQEITAPYAALLSPGERFSFWKDFYSFRIANYQRYNEPLPTYPDPYATAACCVATMEAGMVGSVLNIVQMYANSCPQDADAFWIATEALFKTGRQAEARPLAERARQLESMRPAASTLPKPPLPIPLGYKAPPKAPRPAATSPKSPAAHQALVFFPHNPLPVGTGAHQRFICAVRALQTLGYQVTLFSSTLTTDRPWTPDSVLRLRRDYEVKVHLHETTPADLLHQRQIDAAGGAAFGQRMNPPRLREQFRQAFTELRPDLVVINYATWGHLAAGPEFASATRAIDMLDLVTFNEQMQKRIWSDLGNQYSGTFAPADVPAHLLSEDYFAAGPHQADPAEYAMYDAFDYTLAIAQREAELIAQHAPATSVLMVPAVYDTVALQNTYAGDPLFVIGANTFNVQGHLYFTGRVMPQVVAQLPGFNLRVAGGGCKYLKPQANTTLMGFVDDLDALYAAAPFAICPLIGGTGQQIKVIEAMSRGVPVICLKNVAHSSPIEHGVNGLIAANAEEFAAHVLNLSKDPLLCRRLGTAARETIARQFSQAQLVEHLRPLTARPAALHAAA